MALNLAKEIIVYPNFAMSYLIRVAFAIRGAPLLSKLLYPEYIHGNITQGMHLLELCCLKRDLSMQHFSSSNLLEMLCSKRPSREILLRKLETALKAHQVDEAWATFHDLKRLYGYPNSCLVNKLIVSLSYSSDSDWLQRVYDLVMQIVKGNKHIILPSTLVKLSLSLARYQMPILASEILRLLLNRKILPPRNVLLHIIMHLVKTETGTHLSSNYLVQICDYLKCSSDCKSNQRILPRPDTMIFNLVLCACVKFKLSLKGLQIMELLAKTQTIADAYSVVIISQIQEMNGLRDELKKLKGHIDRLPAPFVSHYCQFYDSLLRLHFKFNDIDAAAELVLGMNRYRDSLSSQKNIKVSQMPCVISIGSDNLKNRLTLRILPELLHKDPVLKIESRQELVIFRDGKLVLSNRALAKFISGYKGSGRISELSKMLAGIQKTIYPSAEYSFCSDVFNTCIHLGWLETAHDIMDDMEDNGDSLGWPAYRSLLAAYHKRNMFKEANALVKQVKKVHDEGKMCTNAGDRVNEDDLDIKTSVSVGKPDLLLSMIQELKDERKVVPPMVFEFNSSIYFFCKAKMMEDALGAYRRMHEMKFELTVQTFAHLICAYSSLSMHREITYLWGDIKRFMKSRKFVASRDLYELLLMNFIRGGYFERVMEVICQMGEQNMYADKLTYKSEFLRVHKSLYRNLEASNAKTEVQRKRLEHVQAFRKWLRID